MPPAAYIDEAGMRRLLTSREGPVARDLARRAVRVESAAKRNLTANGSVDTGRLRSSVHWQLGRDARGVYADVGTNVFYGILVERGTRPHVIRPVTAQALFWPGAQHPVAIVNHPGTRAKPWLRPALAAARTP